jgi:hypothetical protein
MLSFPAKSISFESPYVPTGKVVEVPVKSGSEKRIAKQLEEPSTRRLAISPAKTWAPSSSILSPLLSATVALHPASAKTCRELISLLGNNQVVSSELEHPFGHQS